MENIINETLTSSFVDHSSLSSNSLDMNQSLLTTSRSIIKAVDYLTIDDKLLIVKIRLIVYAYMVLPIAIVGIALNSFTVVVLMHPKLRTFSTNAYLTALSVANIVCLINFVFLYSLRYLLSNDIFKKNVYGQGFNEVHVYESFINLIYGIWSPIFTTFQLFAIYLTCAVTIDRWICVTWPLKVEHICTMKNTLRCIVLLFIFCVLYNLPHWFEIESFQVNSVHTNTTYYQARLTSFGKNPIYIEIMRKYAYLIFVYGVPFLILLIVNIGIIRKLIETKKRKSNLLSGAGKNKTAANNNSATNNSNSNGAGSKLDSRVTLMVLAVVLAFFCSQFPYLIINLLSKSNSQKLWFHIAKSGCDFLAALNYCINFIIYCFFGQKFREIAKTILLNPSLSPYKQQMTSRSANTTVNNQNLRSTNSNRLTSQSNANKTQTGETIYMKPLLEPKKQ